MDYLELLDELKKLDEITLLEALELTSEELVDAFSEKITLNLPKLYRLLRE